MNCLHFFNQKGISVRLAGEHIRLAPKSLVDDKIRTFAQTYKKQIIAEHLIDLARHFGARFFRGADDQIKFECSDPNALEMFMVVLQSPTHCQIIEEFLLDLQGNSKPPGTDGWQPDWVCLFCKGALTERQETSITIETRLVDRIRSDEFGQVVCPNCQQPQPEMCADCRLPLEPILPTNKVGQPQSLICTCRLHRAVG